MSDMRSASSTTTTSTASSVERALPQEVRETAGARDEHVDALCQPPVLGRLADAAVNGADATRTRVGQGLELSTDLRGQLTRRREDQGGRSPLLGPADARQQRQTERDRLSGARRRSTADVAAGDRVGDRQGLYGKGRLDTPGCEHGNERAGYAEIGEGGRQRNSSCRTWEAAGRNMGRALTRASP